MSVGLDLSSTRFRSLRREGERLVARACSASYAVLLDSPARRDLFAERRIPYAEFGMNLLVFGDAAMEWGERLSITPIPLCLDGRLRIEDRIIRQVTTALVEGLLPRPEASPDDCCLTIPGGLARSTPTVMEFLAKVLKGFGYRASVTSQSLAVALSELGDFGMNGIGMHLGRDACELSIVRQGRELARCDIPIGLEGSRAKGAAAADHSPSSDVEDMLREIFGLAAFELNRRPEGKALAGPVALAVSGEIADPSFDADLVPICAQHASWPFAVGPVLMATDPEWSVGRGCLIQAELEQLAEMTRRAA